MNPNPAPSQDLQQNPVPNAGNVSTSHPFDWEKFWSKFVVSAGIIALLLTIIGGMFAYVLRTSDRFITQESRIGKLEGQVQILLEDRKDGLNKNPSTNSATSR